MMRRPSTRRRLSSASARHQTAVVALHYPPFVALGCILVIFGYLLLTFVSWIISLSSAGVSSREYETGGAPPPHGLAALRQRFVYYDAHNNNNRMTDPKSNSIVVTETRNLQNRNANHRLAIIIPFIGQGPMAIPAYLELFCTCAAGSATLIDFLLFHDGVLDGFYQQSTTCPDNVRFISLGSLEGFARALIKVTDRTSEEDFPSEIGGSKEHLVTILAKHIVRYPYVMVEFKPALGHIFAEYLKDYTHWGYSDLDIIFGDIARWITPDELNDYDIVTYGFGDQEKLYLRGQFTFHKNDPDNINQLWRGCDYLSHMEIRFAKVLSGEDNLRFESAEGCYSAAVLENTDIKIKYAVKAYTDVKGNDTAVTHGIYVSTGKRKDRTVIYKASRENPQGLAALPDNWFETRGSLYANPKNLLYKPVGKRERIPVVKKKDAHCMYWAQKKYQSRLCIDNVDPTDTVYWIDGQLYKEKFELASLPGDISSAPFFHFQEWKRLYRPSQLGGFHRKGPSSTFILSKEGVLPMLPPRITGSSTNIIVKTKDKSVLVPSPLGLDVTTWRGVQDDDRQQLPHHYYCLRSGPKQNSKDNSCKFMASWRSTNTVEIMSGAPGWSKLDVNSEVTLSLTLQIHADQTNDSGAIEGFLNLLTIYLDRWQGQPAVLVVHVAGATPEVAELFRAKFGKGSEDLTYYGLGSVLVATIFTQGPDVLSRKALMNMAIDAAPTRWVLCGYELERGIVVSQDTSYFVHRTAQIQKDFPGATYVIPQFGLVEGDHDLSVGGLELAHLDGHLKSFSDIEEAECQVDDDEDAQNSHGKESEAFIQIENLWWDMTRRLTQENPVAMNEKIVEQQALALDQIQLRLTSLLTEKHQYDLYSTDVSPILLFDNLGPRNGMITSEMVREVDELGGKLCYNSLRLAQMAALGYHINVLAGAFAVSTPATRRVIGDPSEGSPGVSRCDGCFFYQGVEQEDVLEEIALDERMRPAKLAILWEHSANPLKGHT